MSDQPHDCANFHTLNGQCTLCGKPTNRDARPLADPNTEFDRYQASPNNAIRKLPRVPRIVFDRERRQWTNNLDGVQFGGGPSCEGGTIGPYPEPDFENPTWQTMMEHNIGTPLERDNKLIAELRTAYAELQAEYEALHWQYVERTGERP